MKIFYRILIISILLVGSTKTAQAIPPPDFIFNVGNQIIQIFTFLALGFSIVIASLKNFFERYPFFSKHKKLIWAVLAIGVVALSFGGAYGYSVYKQKAEYAKWVEQSKQQDIGFETSGNELDSLKIGDIRGPQTVDANDVGAQFMKAYYNNLGTGKLKEAYDVSSKIVDYQTYAGWYKNTIGVNVDSVQKIDENKYSLGLTLKERDNSITRYAVLMELNNTNNFFTIKNSDVRVLAENDAINSTEYGYFDSHASLPVMITNADFNKIPSNAFILDAREDEEFEIGNYPGSQHIRFADIKSGEWIKIPVNQTVYVLCWSGIRGKEVADFLRSKKVFARYVENGADGWVNYGGKWEGGIKFRDVYNADRYKVVFTTEQARQYVQDGVVIVDSRNAEKYRRHHIPDSVSIPIIYTPSSKIEEVLRRVPPNSRVITVCDDFVSCFDATVTGVKLENRGHTFLGRYNRPWEF